MLNSFIRNPLKAFGSITITIVLLALIMCSSDKKQESLSTISEKRLSVVIDRILQEEAAILPDSLIGIIIPFHGQLDSAAKVILSEKELYGDTFKKLDRLKKLIFNEWKISFQDAPNKLQSIFPHQAFNARQGSCLSISLIFLLLAEKLDLPLYGVLAPGHFFIRYDDGKIRLNIETLRKGEFMSDSWYRNRYMITDTNLYDLANLSVAAVEASIRYNLGNFYLKNYWPDLAIKQFNLAIELNPSYIEAHGNRAIALDAAGNPDVALKSLLRLKKDYPQLAYLNQNLGALYLKQKNYSMAIYEYKNALSIVPSDTESLYGLGISYYYLNQMDKATEVLRELLRISPEHHEGNLILTALKRDQ
ncbi:MAG: tetratricopeptide repeat protein [Fibrobacter sp.]|nr:tetratricopeptide repeat protein [Fibrobacter sp.]